MNNFLVKAKKTTVSALLVLSVCFALLLLIAAIGLIISLIFFLGWQGEWFSVVAIIIAYYMGIANRAFTK
jgi:hypothetical protein